MDPLRALALLKQRLLERYRQEYPHFRGSLVDFRQKDIANFQQLLEEQEQDRVSEKWFYTHLKVETNEKLPRIDTLNLLSRFAGFPSWEAFCYAHEQQNSGKQHKWMAAVMIAVLLGILVITAAFRWWPNAEENITLCFYDALRKTPITELSVTVNMQVNNETMWQGTTPVGESCLTFSAVEKGASYICTARYYHPETVAITGTIAANSKDVYLQADDYALMIHYFSNSKVTDWKSRREQLAQVFSDEAIIYQLDPEGLRGMDILNKSDFINRMTIPSKSLRGVEVLSTTYLDGKIIELRFTIKE